MRTRVHRGYRASLQLRRSLARLRCGAPPRASAGRHERPAVQPHDVLGRGRPHAQLLARDADDPVRVLEHADLDVQAPALLRQLGVGAPLAPERVRDLDAVHAHGDVRQRARRAQRQQERPDADARGGCRGPVLTIEVRRHGHHSLSAARSRADRARGLRRALLVARHDDVLRQQPQQRRRSRCRRRRARPARAAAA